MSVIIEERVANRDNIKMAWRTLQGLTEIGTMRWFHVVELLLAVSMDFG